MARYLKFTPPAPPAKGRGDEDQFDDFLDALWASANARAGCLLLADGPKGTVQTGSCAAVPGVTTKVLTENCGGAYQDLYTRITKGVAVRRVGALAGMMSGGGGGGGSGGGAAAPSADEYRAATAAERKAMSGFAAEGNYYGLLDLEGLNLAATEAQIRAAHSRQVKRFHPDKAKSGAGGVSEGAKDDADAENVFLALNKAFEELCIPERRRAFDSTYKFDEAIPPAKLKGDFFETYRPVFERNARFSSILPVPALGGPEEDDASVKAFYTFWSNFDSWRDFTHQFLSKQDAGTSREEKRHQEKESKAEATKAKKAEIKRVNELTERARASDPRWRAMQEREEKERNAAKNAKAAAKAAEEAAAAAAVQAEAEAKARAEAEAEEAKRGDKFAKEREKKHLSRSKAALRKLATAPPSATDPCALTETNLEFLLAKLEASAAIELHRAVFGPEAAEAVRLLAVSDAEKACAPKEKKAGGAAAGAAAGGSKESTGSAAAAAPAANVEALVAALRKERGL